MSFECTKENPWNKNIKGSVIHHDANEIHNSQENCWPSGDTVRMKCNNCGHQWTVELPQ